MSFLLDSFRFLAKSELPPVHLIDSIAQVPQKCCLSHVCGLLTPSRAFLCSTRVEFYTQRPGCHLLCLVTGAGGKEGVGLGALRCGGQQLSEALNAWLPGCGTMTLYSSQCRSMSSPATTAAASRTQPECALQQSGIDHFCDIDLCPAQLQVKPLPLHHLRKKAW